MFCLEWFGARVACSVLNVFDARVACSVLNVFGARGEYHNMATYQLVVGKLMISHR